MMLAEGAGLPRGGRTEGLARRLSELVILAIIAAVSLGIGNPSPTGFHEFKLLLFQLLLAVLIGIFLFSRGSRGKGTAVDIGVLAFLFLHFLSLYASILRGNPQVVISCRAVFVVLSYVAFFFLLSRLHLGEAGIVKVMICLGVTGTLVALEGVLEVFGMGILPWKSLPGIRGKLWSTLGNPNAVAQYLVAVIPLGVVLGSLVRKPAARVLTWAGIVIMVICLLLTGSQGGWIALALGLIFLKLWLRWAPGGGELARVRKILSASQSAAWVVVISALMVLGFCFLLLPLREAHPGRGSRIQERLSRLELGHSYQGRLAMWKGAANMIRRYPLLGLGPGRFGPNFPAYRPPEWHKVLPGRNPRRAHNDYLQFAAEAGLVLPVVFVLLLLFHYRTTWQMLKREKTETVPSSGKHSRFLQGALLASLTATLTHSMFSFNLQLPASALSFWLVLGLSSSLNRPGKPAANDAEQSSLASYFLRGIILAGFLFQVFAVSFLPYLGDHYLRRGGEYLSQAADDLGSGRPYLHRQKEEKALRELKQAVRIDPERSKTHHLLGVIHLRRGDLETAARELTAALELEPGHRGACLALGHYWDGKGKWAQALEQYELLLELDPLNEEVQDLVEQRRTAAREQ